MHNVHGDRLYTTRYGHVLQCECCDRVQITFREHTLLVDEDEFELLVDTIDHARQEVQNEEGPDRWRLQAGTDAGSVSIVLPEPSLRTLNELLQGAWSMYLLQERVRAVGSGTTTEAPEAIRAEVQHRC